MKLDKIKEIHCTLISKSGYPIYDLMQDIKPSDGNGGYVSGYVGATGTVFYTQDDTLLNKFRSLTSLQEKKDFLLENKSCLKKDSEIAKMSHNEAMAYAHLSSPKAFENTMKKQYYGCAHLLEGDSLLIFHQSHLRYIYQNADLSDKDQARKATASLSQAYAKGEISPEGKIEGAALEKIKNSLYVLPPHTLRKEIELLCDFINYFDVKIELTYPSNKEVNISLNQHNYLVAQSNKKDKLVVNNQEMTLATLMKNIHSESKIVDSQIDNIIKRKLTI